MKKFNYSLAIKDCLEKLKLNIKNNCVGEEIVLEAINIMEEVRISVEELSVEVPSMELSVYKKEFLSIYEGVVGIKVKKLKIENKHHVIRAIIRIVTEILEPYIRNQVKIFDSVNSINKDLSEEEK